MMDQTSPDYAFRQIQMAANLTSENAEEATNNICELIAHYPIESLINFSSFILSDDPNIQQENIIMSCVIYMSRIIGTPSKSKFGEFWLATSGEYKDTVVNAVGRGLLFGGSIGPQAARLYAKLFNYAYAGMQTSEYIIQLLTNQEIGPEIQQAVFELVIELVSPENVEQDDPHITELSNVFTSVMSEFLQKFNEMEKFDKTYQLAIINCLSSFITRIKVDYLKEMNDSILSIAETKFPYILDEDIFLQLYRLLYAMIGNVYNSDNIENYIDLTRIYKCGLNGLSCPEPLINKVFVFWFFILDYECKTMNRADRTNKFLEYYHEKFQDTKPSFLILPPEIKQHNLIRDIASELIDPMLQLSIPPADDFEIESVNDPSPSMWACEILRQIAILDSSYLEKIREFREANITSDQWNVQHALICLAYAFCTPDMRTRVQNRDYCREINKYIVESLYLPDTPLRLDETSVYMLFYLQKTFNFFNKEMKGEIVKLFQGLMLKFEKDPKIALRAVDLITQIARDFIFDESGFIDKIEEIVMTMFNKVKEVYPRSVNLTQVIYKLFYIYVFRISKWDNEKVLDYLTRIYNEIISLFDQQLDDSSNAPLYHTNIQCNLWIVTAIFKKYHEYLPVAAPNVASNFLALLKAHDVLHEDILNSLFAIINAFPKNLSEDTTLGQIIEYIPSAINSKSPTLTVLSLKALSYMFEKFGEKGVDVFNLTLDNIFNLIDDDGFPINEKGELLWALSRILKVYTNSISTEDVGNLFKKLDNYLTGDFKSIGDYADEFMAELYAAIYTCYTSILMSTNYQAYIKNEMDKNERRKFFRFLVKPLRIFMRYNIGCFVDSNTYGIKLIEAVYDFEDLMIDSFGKDFNIYANHHQFFFFFFWGIINNKDCTTEEQNYKRMVEKVTKC